MIRFPIRRVGCDRERSEARHCERNATQKNKCAKRRKNARDGLFLQQAVAGQGDVRTVE